MGIPEKEYSELSSSEINSINHVADELKIDPLDARKWLIAVGGLVFDSIKNGMRFYTVLNESIHDTVRWPEVPTQISGQTQSESKD